MGEVDVVGNDFVRNNIGWNQHEVWSNGHQYWRLTTLQHGYDMIEQSQFFDNVTKNHNFLR